MVHDRGPGYGTRRVALALLLVSLIAFAVGPVFYSMAGRARSSLAALDGFVMVAVAGLALVHIIPHAVVTAGGGALAVALAGFIGPGLVEHRLERAARQTHTAALVLALSGLAVHEFFDGVGLARAFYDPETGISVLAVAVVLHRLPIAITVWWLLRPLRGPALAWIALASLGAATLLGYASGDAVSDIVDARWLGLLEALIAGSLLHVVVHRPSPLSAPGHGRRERLSAGVGALFGLAAVVALGSEHHIPLHGHESIGFADIFTALAMESAPALLLAFALAGAVQVALPRATLGWMRTGNPTTEAMRGVAFGLPLPICSCSVVPLYQSLVTSSVPATAALGFLIATPQLGFDSVLLSVPLLGFEFTVVRVAAAIVLALLVGTALGRMVERRRAAPAAPDPPIEPRPLRERLRAGLHFGFGEVVDHTAPWIVLGIAIASLAEPALHGSWLTALPWGVDVALFALAGMPAYVCASGATPLAAVLIHKGVSPGAALAFLLTGAVTSATAFGALSRLHGRRAALAFGGITAAVAIALGVAANLIMPHASGIALYEEAAADASVAQIICLAGFTFVVALSVLRQGPRGFVGQILAPYGGDAHSHDHDHEHGVHAHPHGAPRAGGGDSRRE
jgi:uncharacterized protein